MTRYHHQLTQLPRLIQALPMNRRVFTASVASYVLAPSLWAAPTKAGRRASTIAVYSDLLNASCTCCASQDIVAVIDMLPSLPAFPLIDAHDFTPMQHLTLPEAKVPYLAPPADQVTNAQEMLHDLAAQYSLPMERIDAEVTITSPHMFVSIEEKRELMRLHPQSQVLNQQILDDARSVPTSLKKKFEHAGTIYSFSPVGFNTAATMAVVWVGSSGGGCADEQWQVLKRNADGWKRLPWNNFRSSLCT